MLPKKRRLSRHQFSDLTSGGRYLSSSYISVRVFPYAGPSLFSFSASKKTSPKAVDRNKLRRRGYSIIEKNLPKVKPGFLVVFSFKKEALDISYAELEKIVINLLGSSGVLL